jgi:DNA-binding winged helix-turn-helix (wHTH) protein/tetratricopeptide (TPR) repeat protein
VRNQPKRLYEFGPFRLDSAECLLLRDGSPVSLTPKVFDTLLVLIENSGHLVEKDELMKRLWPDTFVEEVTLARNISDLRKALGEASNGQKYIDTVPKRGYRFVGRVSEVCDESSELIVEKSTRSHLVIEEEEESSTAHEYAAEAEQSIQERTLAAGRWEKSASRWRLTTAAFAACLLLVGVIVFVHFNGAPALTERDTVLLSDFVNTTGEDIFEPTLKQGLAVQLEQSPFLSIFPDERVRDTLRYMGHSPDEGVTREVAREICERRGLKAMLAGSISSLGSHYVIGLEAINACTGDVIAREQVEAESKEQVLKALGRAATHLRQKLGEPLNSIQKFDAPLEQATTSSLEAFKAYSLGNDLRRAGKRVEAIPSLKRAIELDPNFALAYSQLGVAYRNNGQPELAIEFAQKAFELRDRASEREKFRISLSYYSDVTREMDKQFEVVELWKRSYPRDYEPPNSLAIRYRDTGQYEKAVEAAREAIQLDPNWVSPYANLGIAFIHLNRFEEAREVYERAFQQNLDVTSYHANLYKIAFVHGDTVGMKQQIDWFTGKPDEYLAYYWQADAAAFAGQLRQAREFSRRAVDFAERRNLKETAAGFALSNALREAAFGNCRETRADSASALALDRGRGSLLIAAIALAICGEVRQAQLFANDLAQRYPQATMMNALGLSLIRAAIELQRGNPDQAIQLMQPASRYEGGSGEWTGEFWPIYLRGQAYLRKRSGTEAAAEFQKILDHRGWDPTSCLYPLAHLGLARAVALTGDTAGSRKRYQDFFALWKDADQDLPIFQEAQREYEKLK